MKILNGLIFVLLVAFASSCEENEIEYDATPISDKAEFQLHYFVPVTAGAANNIYKIEINDQLYANNTAPLNTYNAMPNSTGRFFAVDPGTVNIKLYQGLDEAEVLVYDQNTELVAGKQNVFVHDFNTAPVVFDNGYPYAKNVTADTDSSTWVKFYNFLYETAGTPTVLRLQYQYLDPRTKEPVNIGQPVAFGETTGWQEVKVVKEVFNSSGSARIDYRIKVVDGSGNITGDLQVRNTSGVFVNYADFWNGFIGRRVHHVYAGMRAATPAAAVRQMNAQ
jgi:hypothetical protein